MSEEIPEETAVPENVEPSWQEKYERLLSAYAEADNRSKRAEKERAEALRYAVQTFARDLTEVLDAVDQAVAAATPEGIEAVQRLFEGVCRRHGLTPVRPVDELFDPYRHEAVAQEPATDPLRAGYVVRVLQTGYALHDRLLRPARVVVGI